MEFAEQLAAISELNAPGDSGKHKAKISASARTSAWSAVDVPQSDSWQAH